MAAASESIMKTMNRWILPVLAFASPCGVAGPATLAENGRATAIIVVPEVKISLAAETLQQYVEKVSPALRARTELDARSICLL